MTKHYMHGTLGDNANWPATSELLPVLNASGITWGEAADQLGSGDTLLFGGPVTARFTPGASGLSKDAMITLDGNWPGDKADFDLSGGGTINLYLNGVSYIHAKNFTASHEGGTASIFFAGITAGNILENLDITTQLARGIYMANPTHTDWEILDCDMTNSTGAGSNTQTVQIWGNSGVGSGGVIRGLTVNGVTVFDKNDSSYVGLQIEDWDGVLVEDFVCRSVHSALKIIDADNNRILRPDIRKCGVGTKTGGDGGGQGITTQGTSLGNIVEAGYFDENYIHILFNSSGINQEAVGNLMLNASVNSLAYQTNAAGGRLISNTIIHNPTDTEEGHGLVVQNGGALTEVEIKNNLITCASLAVSNIQCITIGSALFTNYAAIDIDNNCYYAPNGAHIGALDGVNQSTFASWKSAILAKGTVTGYDLNSLNKDPLLELDYTLGEGSPCIGAGKNVGLYGYDTHDQPVPGFGEDIGIQSKRGGSHPAILSS